MRIQYSPGLNVKSTDGQILRILFANNNTYSFKHCERVQLHGFLDLNPFPVSKDGVKCFVGDLAELRSSDTLS